MIDRLLREEQHSLLEAGMIIPENYGALAATAIQMGADAETRDWRRVTLTRMDTSRIIQPSTAPSKRLGLRESCASRKPLKLRMAEEKHDDEMGKEVVLHYLPPPPDMLPDLYQGYFDCVTRREQSFPKGFWVSSEGCVLA